MMPNKQNVNIDELTGFKESDIKVVKAMMKWNYQNHKCNARTLAYATGLAESTVSKSLDRMWRHKGYINKSPSGSYYMTKPLIEEIKRIQADVVHTKQVSVITENKDKPIDTTEEFDKQIKDIAGVDQERIKQQRMKDQDTRMQKRIDLRKFGKKDGKANDRK